MASSELYRRMCARLSVGRSLDEAGSSATVDEARAHVMKILFAGIIARYPFGGVTWCSLMYLLGLRALGHEVLYIEDTGECIYDPERNAISLDPVLRHALHSPRARAIRSRRSLELRQLRRHVPRRLAGGRARLLRRRRSVRESVGRIVVLARRVRRIPRRVFIDSDPVFTQLAIAKGEGWYVDFFRGFDRLFTFGANIGTPASDVPTGEFTWHKTWQPVIDRSVAHRRTTRGDRFTTVMTWKTESFTDVDGNKDREFVRFITLPGRTTHRFELAVNGPQDLLREHGWAPIDAMSVSRSLWDYRDFIQASKAEFGVAKHAYVTHRSGWFSDRTECYLAAGRPALVQDTGWSAHLPSGTGLLTFSTLEEAIAGLEAVERDYAVHARRAREIAREYFDASRVLPPFLERACA